MRLTPSPAEVRTMQHHLRMAAAPIPELLALMDHHIRKPQRLFSDRVIARAASEMVASKRRIALEA